MKPEEKARQKIDDQLLACGWVIQDLNHLNLSAGLGVAVREFPLASGFADYLLFVDRKAAGVIEAKAVGATLSGVAEQTTAYQAGLPANVPHVTLPLPFAYETTGIETYFRDGRDPQPKSRRVFTFHRPAALKEWLAKPATLRARLCEMPPLDRSGLRDCQYEAITGLEQSFAADRPRALIQMATGSGKTYTAVSFVYRLIKFAGAKRVLFLVDRSNLGRQTLREFQQYRAPDDGRLFTELYNVQHLASNTIDPVCKVTITTIQRLYSMLRGEELDPQAEEASLFDLGLSDSRPREVSYNPALPIESFDFIITDECHRSIYNLWRQVLDYFDASLIGLTATPSKQTLGFFGKNLVTEYSHERAVADGVNVGYNVYRIRTKISEQGSTVEAGAYVDRRDRLTRALRVEQLDEDLEYAAPQLDREVVALDQIRTILSTVKARLFSEIFPGRSEVPKMLIFAKDDNHAEDIVHLAREVWGKGNDFCKKITYRTSGEKPEDLIASFRNSYNPRIAVTVDMISTGTDIKPLECLLFLRTVRSQVYFEQMKGRGTRTISPTDLLAVTPDAEHKPHFVIIDAVGVCEEDKTDSRPLERKPGVRFDKLIQQVAIGIRDTDTLSSLAGRLARIDQQLTAKERGELEALAGQPLKALINGLFDALDPDCIADAAAASLTDAAPGSQPGDETWQQTAAQLADEACRPFDDPALRQRLIELAEARRRAEQTIDSASLDEVTQAGFDEAAREAARGVVHSFQAFIEDNKDRLDALHILYARPYALREVTYAQVRALAEAIERPPYRLRADEIWQAYAQLEQARVRRAGPEKLLTNIVALVRFALHQTDVLEPFPATIEERFRTWLVEQELAGRRFTPEQVAWLRRIKDQIATSLRVENEDFEYAPFTEMGGLARVYQLFGAELGKIMEELNEVLVR
jgi:type I restriction enzyme R subunit